MAGIPIYETAVQPEWIDYNGHVRDAYYALIVSLACDALMDRVGLDEAYRTRTGCTLYTLELHLHYLQEVHVSDTAIVSLRIVGADHKRIHAAFEIGRRGRPGVAASAEMLLLHVRQGGDGVASAAFPPQVSAALAQLQADSAALPPEAPGSRRMELRPPART
ncbi:MAG: thioesterase family protein [Gammaproteobacteria bacterium]|nr:thioesterase family protein [Gammaproteobacteria bacterium]